MIQEFNEPDLSSMVIPEPDLSVLTSFERSIFGSYIRRHYYDYAVKHKDQMKRNLYYNGMKHTLLTYVDEVFSLILTSMLFLFILMSFLFFAFGFIQATSHIIGDMVSYFFKPLCWVMAGYVALITPFKVSLIRNMQNYRDVNGIPRDKRTKAERRKTPDRYC